MKSIKVAGFLLLGLLFIHASGCENPMKINYSYEFTTTGTFLVIEAINARPNIELEFLSWNVPKFANKAIKKKTNGSGYAQVKFWYNFDPQVGDFCQLTPAQKSQKGSIIVNDNTNPDPKMKSAGPVIFEIKPLFVQHQECQ